MADVGQSSQEKEEQEGQGKMEAEVGVLPQSQGTPQDGRDETPPMVIPTSDLQSHQKIRLYCSKPVNLCSSYRKQIDTPSFQITWYCPFSKSTVIVTPSLSWAMLVNTRDTHEVLISLSLMKERGWASGFSRDTLSRVESCASLGMQYLWSEGWTRGWLPGQRQCDWTCSVGSSPEKMSIISLWRSRADSEDSRSTPTELLRGTKVEYRYIL